MQSLRLLLLILVIVSQNVVNGSIAADHDLTLTASEKRSLDKFKSVMAPYMYNDRLQSEAYLIRWLRASKFDVKRAESLLLENLRWREKYRMDGIHEENWKDFETEFPYYFGNIDKESQPVLFGAMGSWDMRQVIISGKRDRMLRYIFKLLDDVDVQIQEQQTNGKLVTRGNLVVDIDGFNLAQHSCSRCIPLYIEMILAMDRHYPSLYDKLILVNVPSIFEGLLNIVKQAMTADTRKALQVFGKNRKQWQNYLLKYIEEDELPLEYGGNKIIQSHE